MTKVDSEFSQAWNDDAVVTPMNIGAHVLSAAFQSAAGQCRNDSSCFVDTRTASPSRRLVTQGMDPVVRRDDEGGQRVFASLE